ncbi:MAG: hypothetical protein ACHREM_29265, partial [Polyangiales bacterium]
MTDLEDVTRHLDALKGSPPSAVFHEHFSAALRQFRFIPAARRRACADAFLKWSNERAPGAPLTRAYAVFLQGMDRFISEELQSSLALLTEARAVFAEADD